MNQHDDQAPELPIGLQAFADAFIDQLIQIEYKTLAVLQLLDDKGVVTGADIHAKYRALAATDPEIVQAGVLALRKTFLANYTRRYQERLLQQSRPEGPTQ